MLKQVTIQNLFNFKNEVVFDLTNSGSDIGNCNRFP